MVLKNTIELHKYIEKYRQEMHNLAAVKGLDDLDVLEISRKLDVKILDLQFLLNDCLVLKNFLLGSNQYES